MVKNSTNPVALYEQISPAQLDGLSIGLPSDQNPNIPLAHLVIERAGRGDSNKSYQQKYFLQNRKTTLKQDEIKRQEQKTQLIAMAGGNAGLEKDENDKSNDYLANEEMESLHVMLPKRDSDGQYVHAPVKISQYMQLVIETPVQSNDMTGSSDADPKKVAKDLNTNEQTTAVSAGAKRQRAQPWDKLKGFFNPAGSRNVNGEIDESEEKKPKKAKLEQDVDDASSSSSPKKSKKSKKGSA